jgi:ubiquinol-cytochrome c reductase iron-sulfur subunit
MKLTRRGFSIACLSAIGAQCGACRAPSHLSATSLHVDLRDIVPGASRTFLCGSTTIIVRHRTPAQIALVQALEHDGRLWYPEPDRTRSSLPEWIVLDARCTHLGCGLIEGGGRFDGWLCPCHGSEFDPSGRVTRGPADANLRVPPHRFVSEKTLILSGCENRG